MTTIKQLSEDLGVSKQAIYNRITKEPLKSVLAGMEGALQTNAQGTIYLSDAGEQVIRNAYEDKYKRPGEAHKQGGRVAAPKVEFDDSKLDTILLHVSNTQASLQALTHQLLAKDAHIESLTTQLEERGLKNAELSRTARKLTELAAAKETEIQALKSRCAQAEAKAANLQQQLLELENVVVIGDSNEPDPPAAYVETPIPEPSIPIQEPAQEPEPVEDPTVVPEPVAEPEIIKPTEPPQTNRPAAIMLDLDLYEPLINLSNDLSKPTTRLAGLVINE